MRIVTMASAPAVDELIERFAARYLPFVLDSSLSNDGLGQWSFFGAEPFLVFEGKKVPKEAWVKLLSEAFRARFWES